MEGVLVVVGGARTPSGPCTELVTYGDQLQPLPSNPRRDKMVVGSI